MGVCATSGPCLGCLSEWQARLPLASGMGKASNAVSVPQCTAQSPTKAGWPQMSLALRKQYWAGSHVELRLDALPWPGTVMQGSDPELWEP